MSAVTNPSLPPNSKEAHSFADLLPAAMAGDSKAYASLLRAVAVWLRAYYQRSLRGAAITEDLIQETLLAMHTKFHTYDAGKPFQPWLAAIARYKLIDYWRAETARGGLNNFIDLDNAPELALVADIGDATATHDITRHLASLPAKQRAAIEHVKLADYSIAETALKLKISESDVKISIHRGLKTLAALVKEKP